MRPGSLARRYLASHLQRRRSRSVERDSKGETSGFPFCVSEEDKGIEGAPPRYRRRQLEQQVAMRDALRESEQHCLECELEHWRGAILSYMEQKQNAPFIPRLLAEINSQQAPASR